jgi:uncharacterized protein (TIGR03083 family)
MEVAEHIDQIRRQGALLAEAARGTDLDTPIPTTPEWSMRDLVRHVGDVHRWAAAHVAEERLKPIGRDELIEVAGALPDDAGLIDWFRDGHARLVQTLQDADPDVRCWTFLPAPSPLAFWARRQAHETGIHRADAESPGGELTPFSTDIAVDGIEELLLGFFRGDGSAHPSDHPTTLYVRATDADAGWLAYLGERSVRSDQEIPSADCAVRGTASDLYLLLWNRRPPDGLDVTGNPAVLDLWRKEGQIHWGRPR